MSLLDRIHGGLVFKRRASVLSEHLAEMLPRGGRVLDVGCGDGLIAKLVMERRPDVQIEGVDVLVRAGTHIPVKAFDGRTLDYSTSSFEAVMFVDVLHHTVDPMIILREACRVSARFVVIKDHRSNGWLAGPTLRFMDWVGNARHGVVLPYNYWTAQRWDSAFREFGLEVIRCEVDIPLYPAPASWFFGRSLHFIACLQKGRSASTAPDGVSTS